MSTFFPYNLPPVPAGANPWSFAPPEGNDWDEVEVDGQPYSRTCNSIEADNAEQAEQRVLSVLYASYHQELDGAYATAVAPPIASRWQVHVFQAIGG